MFQTNKVPLLLPEVTYPPSGLYAEKIIFLKSDSVKKVISAFNKTAIHTNKSGFAIIVDAQKVCVGVLTDGDIRRKFLDGLSVDDPIEKFIKEVNYLSKELEQLGAPKILD